MADTEALEFPLRASLAGPLWQVPDEAARAQLMPFWAGQAVALVRALPAVQLVEQLAAAAQAGLARSTQPSRIPSAARYDHYIATTRREGSDGTLHGRHRQRAARGDRG
jgi:hypothetical protein